MSFGIVCTTQSIQNIYCFTGWFYCKLGHVWVVLGQVNNFLHREQWHVISLYARAVLGVCTMRGEKPTLTLKVALPFQ